MRVSVSLSGWKCQKCEMRENLWLNLTDGVVLCGKWFFDGSGGNGHALEHYRETNHPLAVKLDTITPDGAGLRCLMCLSELPINTKTDDMFLSECCHS